MSEVRVGETDVPGARRGEQVSDRVTKPGILLPPKSHPDAPRSWSQFVPGIPAPKGSIVQAIDPRTGKRFVKEQVKGVKPWMKAIAEVAILTRPRGGPLHSPVAVRCTFYLRRPKSNTDPFPTAYGKGDVDKMVRAVLDALKGTVLVDDVEVVYQSGLKLWAPSARDTGVWIRAWELTEAEQEALLGG